MPSYTSGHALRLVSCSPRSFSACTTRTLPHIPGKLFGVTARSLSSKSLRSHHQSPGEMLSTPTGTPHFMYIYQPTPFQAIAKPILFTGAIAVGSFTLAAYVWEQKQVTLLKRIQAWRAKPKSERLSARDFVKEQSELLQIQWSGLLEKIRWIQQLELPLEVQKMIFMARQRWMELTPGEVTACGIIAINSVVFGAWQVPRLTHFMNKWFTHHPGQGRSITLLTSMFSHQQLWHFLLNMFSLYSFAMPLHDEMGREQFLAYYVSTGVAASLVSHLFTVARVPWAKMIPSLGASGALFGCIGSVAYMYPETSVYVIFLPFFSIKIPMALGALMGLDLVGVLRNWKMFDHYAHLAGATLGLTYAHYGNSTIWHPLQKKAIEFNNDGNLFEKKEVPPTPNISTQTSQWNSPFGITPRDEHSKDQSAKDLVQARLDKVKAWWNSRRSGGNGEH
ncbi:hypothetical protein BGW38_005671 [Lunasporangiospora selenospora]|uniref:Peptidase S54 rhomboid domain-containing protein n=1 Tax=Lunasporangiospora selenospora TaxID=979761 RepID=A0A9P6FNU2_9FUNG|nr:hypothetical protein BGW38_005671 [Lunasporangiospora selenospora]